MGGDTLCEMRKLATDRGVKMPVYDYKCGDCGCSDYTERSMRDSDTPHPCPQCGANMTRLFTIGAVAFNGNGFASTDK